MLRTRREARLEPLRGARPVRTRDASPELRSRGRGARAARPPSHERVPAGVSTLKLSFEPVAFREGLTISIATGGAVSATGGLTTAAAPGIGNPSPAPVSNTVSLDGATLTVFAGLREDPFFFDVEAFFRVRAALRGEGPAAGFAATLDNSLDFAKGYNVHAIVVRVPIIFLQQGTTNTVLRGLASTRARQGRPEVAARLFARAWRVTGDPAPLLDLVEVRRAQGREPEAAALLDRARACLDDPRHHGGFGHPRDRARLLLLRGGPDRARDGRRELGRSPPSARAASGASKPLSRSSSRG